MNETTNKAECDAVARTDVVAALTAIADALDAAADAADAADDADHMADAAVTDAWRAAADKGDPSDSFVMAARALDEARSVLARDAVVNALEGAADTLEDIAAIFDCHAVEPARNARDAVAALVDVATGYRCAADAARGVAAIFTEEEE